MNALDWLEPLRSSVPELGTTAWRRLERFDAALGELYPTAPAPGDGVAWSAWLREARRVLAARGHRVPGGPAGILWQVLAQFLAGARDLDLRDCIGPGHGAMVLAHARAATAEAWDQRLKAGELIGIAATERHGGSRIREITTRAVRADDGFWRLSGEKCWVSRLVEAAAFVVFVRGPNEHISAVVVDADDPNLEREVVEPAGLGGWTWGVLRLHEVCVDPGLALLGQPGGGLGIFHQHFARFRPLVAATALGTAAGVHSLVTGTLAERRRAGRLPRIRDNASIIIGRTHAEITAALLEALAAARLAAAGHPDAGMFARLEKAAGVDTAVRAVHDLAPLVGAVGFQRGHRIAKARTDLAGLLYADGIHDSLYRAGGISLLAGASGPGRPSALAAAA
ncbi:acyl-CoA dehydrogenase family protein [Actinoplanes sp. NPDC020271]|uniref:acyl-CoA dehydrogenase family protein n=1 Tax=Actinoplanes sp. NPDC020271 TaxID=3363896 RepID=UPI0037A5D0BF